MQGNRAATAAASSDEQLLAVLFSAGEAHDPWLADARRCLSDCGGLRELFDADCRPAEVALPPNVASLLTAAHELVRRYFHASLRGGASLTSPRQSADYLQSELRDRGREVFACLFLDTRHRVIAFEELFKGSIDGACVYPRVVAERALRLGSAAVIAAHNHPSGVAEPSLSDQAITHRLRDALALLDIRLLDHFVIGEGLAVSMAERGLI